MKIKFRNEAEKDKPFLQELYRTTRWEELVPVPWSDDEKKDFLRWQFEAQYTHYQKYFPEAHFKIVLDKNKPIGRLYLDYRDDEIRIVDIALLPEHRNRGIGSKLIKDVMAEAGRLGLMVRIHVEHNNPAMTLYERLGFQKVDEEGVYWLMEWAAQSKITSEETEQDNVG